MIRICKNIVDRRRESVEYKDIDLVVSNPLNKDDLLQIGLLSAGVSHRCLVQYISIEVYK